MAMNKLKSRTQQTTTNVEILKEDRKMIMNLFIVNGNHLQLLPASNVVESDYTDAYEQADKECCRAN